MLEQILAIDQSFFLIINKGWTNAFFDVVMPFMRNQVVWIPLYVLITAYFLWKFRWSGLLWIIWCLTTVGISDFVSSHLIKKSVMRPRPCHMESELTDIILRVDCGSGFSFTSSHATNHMTLAVFIICTTAPFWFRYRWIFLPWALLVGLAQIYVGVHYPADVICGFGLGCAIAVLSVWLYKKSLRKMPPKFQIA